MVKYRQRYESQKAQLGKRAGDSIPLPTAEDIEWYTDAHDDEKRRTKLPEGIDQLSISTLVTRLTHLMKVAETADAPLHTLSTEDADLLLDEWYGELSDNTLRQRQMALRTFIKACNAADDAHDYDADPGGIRIEDQTDTTVDKADLLTWDDIEQIRDGCRNLRDRALVEMLVYTGQRITALATLRIKDVYPDEGNGEYRLNPDADSLKGAEGRRPLLGAKGAVTNWLNNGHPAPDDPDAMLFTPLPTYVEDESRLYEPLSHATISHAIQRAADRGGCTKPVNPHNFRHTFVTIAYREYGLDKDYIKRLIGHKEGSTVMETTYRHLDDDDTIKAAEEAFNLRDEDAEAQATFTPSQCTTCGHSLGPKAKACEQCGAVFSPDAKSATDTFDSDERESLKASDDPEAHDEMDTLREKVRENPELLLELYDDLSRDDDPGGATPAVSDD